MERHAKKLEIDMSIVKKELEAENILGNEVNLKYVINKEFKKVQISEINLKNAFLNGDNNKNGTVTIEYAKTLITTNELFGNKLSSEDLNKVLESLKNDQNQCNYIGKKHNFFKRYQNIY
ncbi:uncharacterized protein LOC126909494 [Daktulosphaira vitifoliae]|uniref:uncharacterized protein LOC126909494 n=1 Tax=Daktulosphaira vitifoliae TaxID=58002 RepID=UPI0021AAAC27|nr:uncharacterized protein LOC126909494 [Daktulosphaira vitifoliae]